MSENTSHDLKTKPSLNSRQIRNFLINPSYQLRYILLMVLAGGILAVALTSVYYLHIQQNYQLLVDLAPMSDAARAQLYKELDNLVFYSSLFAFLFLVLIALIGLVFSHQAAGPIYQLTQVMKNISNGNLDARVHFRPKDDFQESAQVFNAMLDKILRDKK